MTEDRMRAEFEDWAKVQLGGSMAIREDDGCYRDYDIENAWLGWQASRNAVCVHLPKPFGSSTMCNDFLTYGEVTEALDKAGVKYK